MKRMRSNNWVVHGDRTASGKPLLANDVHIGLGLPSTWYERGLHGGRFDVVGFTLPGVPLVVLGHNGRLAWGMSNLGPDTRTSTRCCSRGSRWRPTPRAR